MQLATDPNTVVQKTLSHSSFGEIMLIAKRPTFGELMEAKLKARENGLQFEKFAIAFLVDWHNVVDGDGQIIPFTASRFESACEQFPALLTKAVEFAAGLFYPLDDAAEKN